MFDLLMGPEQVFPASDQSGPGSDGDEKVHCIPQISSLLLALKCNSKNTPFWGERLRSYDSARDTVNVYKVPPTYIKLK